MKRLSTFLSLICLPVVAFAAGETGLVSDKPADGRSVQTDAGYMVPYTLQIPGSDVSFEMVPIPGGTFKMGSPGGEAGREDVEGPQITVKVEPFWMGCREVRWAEYKQYMDLYTAFKEFEVQGVRKVTDENRIDAITAPTPLYEPDFTFEYGEDPDQPAVTISQYSAKQYTKWMTAITGMPHRLPTEAEWEYACRAGSTTAYHFGDDASQLGDYAWFAGNTDDSGTQIVGQKKPNQWGLYDMHGNAAEWVMDALEPYKASDKVLNAATDWVRPKEIDPRIVRGGSWEFDAEACRSASRYPSDHEAWREYDPNLPKSPWWLTTDPARGVGFRIIRPLKTVSREQMEEFWKIDVEDIELDVNDRLSEGRGVLGIVDGDLPKAIKELE